MMVAPTLATAMTATWAISTCGRPGGRGHLDAWLQTVRDHGRTDLRPQRAIDEGITAGPRIYPSGAFISQTAGHGDFRQLSEIPDAKHSPRHAEQIGVAAIADTPDEVGCAPGRTSCRAPPDQAHGWRRRVVPFGPLDTVQYTRPELHAAVEAARIREARNRTRLYATIDQAGDRCRRSASTRPSSR